MTSQDLPMKYNQLGKSGLKVSQILLGAMSFGDPKQPMPWSLPEEDALPILKHAFDKGINTWDTSDLYSFGSSERILGAAIKKYAIPRNRLVILTKCYAGLPDDPDNLTPEQLFAQMSQNDGVMVNRIGLSRKHIFDAVDASVARLGTYIDVLQIHRLDRETPREEIMKALHDVVENGKVRYLGASSMATWEFQALNAIADKRGWHKFVSMQDHYSMLHREGEREMIPFCRDAGIGLIPWSPLARGLLARPFSAASTMRQQNDPYSEVLIGPTTETDKAIIKRVEELAQKKSCTMAAVSVAWCLRKGVNPILGLGSVKRVDEAVDAVVLAEKGLLTDEDMKFLDELYVAKPALPLL